MARMFFKRISRWLVALLTVFTLSVWFSACDDDSIQGPIFNDETGDNTEDPEDKD